MFKLLWKVQTGAFGRKHEVRAIGTAQRRDVPLLVVCPFPVLTQEILQHLQQIETQSPVLVPLL